MHLGHLETAIKAALQYDPEVGYECKSPRGCLKLAYKRDWREDEEKWLRLLEARNFLANANFEMFRFFFLSSGRHSAAYIPQQFSSY